VELSRASRLMRTSPPSRASEPAIRWAGGSDDLSGALAVRDRVFCGEQGVPKNEEVDLLDEQALHLVALDPHGGAVIGTLRLLISGGEAKIGRVAVEPGWRRRGVASRMLRTALEAARGLGCTSARLAAQLQATELYEAVGFAVDSPTFEEAGIPHVWMERRLEPAGRRRSP
jgi:predicted GNAT family N-acyltransferase